MQRVLFCSWKKSSNIGTGFYNLQSTFIYIMPFVSDKNTSLWSASWFPLGMDISVHLVITLISLWTWITGFTCIKALPLLLHTRHPEGRNEILFTSFPTVFSMMTHTALLLNKSLFKCWTCFQDWKWSNSMNSNYTYLYWISS